LLRNKIFLFCIFLTISVGSLWCENWTIAAEKFELIDVPPQYSYIQEVLPSLLLSAIPSQVSRSVSADETVFRKKASLNADYIKRVRERSSIYSELDNLFFYSGSEKDKKKKRTDILKKIEKKEIELEKTKAEIDALDSGVFTVESAERSISLWKNGAELYVRKSDTPLSLSLRSDSVSYLITGTVEDLGGYAYVSLSSVTGIPGIEPFSVYAAAPYEEIDFLAKELSWLLVSSITNKKPVNLQLISSPTNARIFIGEMLVSADETVVIPEGTYTIRGQATGYHSSEWTGFIGGNDTFRVEVNLTPITPVNITFRTEAAVSLMLGSRYFGDTEHPIPVPSFPVIGSLASGDTVSWFVLDQKLISRPVDTSLSESDHTLSVDVRKNSINTKKRIEKQRNTLYWSLAALYASLPFSLMLYGKTDMMKRAYIDGKLPQDDATVHEINNWITASSVAQGVSFGFGLNYIVQLVRYFIAVDQVVPQTVSRQSGE